MWLLEKNTIDMIRAAGPDHPEITAEVIAAHFAGRSIREDVDGVAKISVSGVLEKELSFISFLFGGTAYSDIIEQVQAADADDNIKAIEMHYDSPGGNVLGYFETFDAIRSVEKPVKSVVSSMAASAAFGLATAGDVIEASSRGNMVGSVGVAAQIWAPDDIVDVASTQAPKKRPDARTDEGKAIIREELDAMHAEFAGSIAEGRSAATGKKISVKTVNEKYGQGAIVLARDALDRGMIDALREGKPKQAATQHAAAAKTEDHSMDLAKLKAEHPGIYAEAVAEGVAEERDRVVAHLTFGEKCNAMPTAIKAIRDGEGMTNSLTAEYMTAGLNKADLDAMADDNPDTGDAGASDPAPEDMQAKVDQIMAEKLGLEA